VKSVGLVKIFGAIGSENQRWVTKSAREYGKKSRAGVAPARWGRRLKF